MGSKRVLPSFQIVNGPNPKSVSGAMTGAAVITSNPTNIENLDNIGLQISWTGAPVGNLSINCSIDGINYLPLTFGPPITQPAGAPGGFLVNLTELPYPWIQLQYTNISGTGTLSAFICGKDLN
jgi:hypothetical protein